MNIKEKNSLEGNLDKVYLMNFFDGLQFTLPIFAIFLLDNGMNLAQIGLILGGAYIVQFILDIPFSIWADKHSRKSFLILSNVSFMLLNLILYLSHSFEMFFLAYCFNGLGTAFTSGISGAFVYDTLLSLGKEKQYENVQVKIIKNRFVGKIIAIGAGGYIYHINPRMPFLLQALSSLVCVVIAFRFMEPLCEKSISKTFNQIKEGAGFLFKHKIIWVTVIVFCFADAIHDILVNYYQPVMRASGISSLTYFSAIYIFVNILGLLGAHFYPKIKSKIDWKNIMVIYLLVNAICSVFFGIQNAVLVVFSIALFTFVTASYDIYISSILHKLVPSSHRATTLSLFGLMYNLFSFILIYIISFFMDRYSIFVGMLVSALIMLAVLLVFIKIVYNKNRRDEHLLLESYY